MKIQIGEMAELQGISNQTLHYYDRIGLLHPAVNPVNGYRYYTEEHIVRLDTILSLKNSGLSLKAIREFMDKSDPAETVSLLEQQSRELEEKINLLTQTKTQLDRRLEEVGRYSREEAEMGFAELGALDLAFIDVPAGGDTLAHETLIKRLFTHVKKLEYQYFLNLGATVDRRVILERRETELPVKTFVIPLSRPFPESPRYTRLPAARCAYIYHKGDYRDSFGSYGMLLDYIREKGHEICGDSLELPVIDPLLTGDPDRYVTEILIPVRESTVT